MTVSHTACDEQNSCLTDVLKQMAVLLEMKKGHTFQSLIVLLTVLSFLWDKTLQSLTFLSFLTKINNLFPCFYSTVSL